MTYQEIRQNEEVLAFLKARNPFTEVLMTGHAPIQELVDAADYVSEIKKIKHPYDEGAAARKGIEF